MSEVEAAEAKRMEQTQANTHCDQGNKRWRAKVS